MNANLLRRGCSEHLVYRIKEEESGLLLVNMDNGLVMMTGKSQSHTTTSRTISISLTLQAHPLSRMKKVTCWLSTFHLQPAVQRAPMMVTLCTSPLLCYPATTCPEAKLILLHTAGDPVLHHQCLSPFITHGTALTASWGATCQLRASGDVWMGFTWELGTPLPPQRGGTREATYGRLRWIPLLFQRTLRGLRGDRNFTLLFTRLSLIISQ